MDQLHALGVWISVNRVESVDILDGKCSATLCTMDNASPIHAFCHTTYWSPAQSTTPDRARLQILCGPVIFQFLFRV